MVETARSTIFLLIPVNSFYNIAAHIQNVGSTVINLKSSLGDGLLLGGADQQPGV